MSNESYLIHARSGELRFFKVIKKLGGTVQKWDRCKSTWVDMDKDDNDFFLDGTYRVKPDNENEDSQHLEKL